MRIVTSRRLVLVSVCAGALVGGAGDSSAQIVESVGSRALGMGGAFVAVASDSSATWWNPAGLAAGPFVDLALARDQTERAEGVPARRDRVTWFAATVPALGFSHYRLKITDIQRSGTTVPPDASREDTQVGGYVRSFSASLSGLTLVQSVLPGVHAGTTFKYVRGTLRDGTAEVGQSPAELLDDGEGLDGGKADNRFDLDVGVLGVAGPLRVGAVIRNVRAPKFGGGAFALPRQARVGVALDLARPGGSETVVSMDADVARYTTATGDRRVVALGAEHWLSGRRIGIRGGGRLNLVGPRERVATGGVSVLVGSGLYVEGHVVRGGDDAERGWGIGARVSY